MIIRTSAVIALTFAAGQAFGNEQEAPVWKISHCPWGPIEVMIYKMNTAQTEVTLHPNLFENNDVVYAGTSAIFRDGTDLAIFNPVTQSFRVVEEYEMNRKFCFATDELLEVWDYLTKEK